MAEGERDANFWVLLVIAVVTVVCAAYTLLAATGVLGEDTPTATAADGKQPEPIVGASTGSTPTGSTPTGNARPEDTDHAVAVPERTATAQKTTPVAAAPAGLVTAVGDSTMLGAVDALQQEIPNLALIDAQGSRQPQAAIDLLRQYRADGHLGEVVIVHVGNNGPLTAEQFDEMMGVLSGVRKVLVVNLTVPPDVEDPVAVPNDAVLVEGVRRYPNKAELVDWYSVSADHAGYLWDGTHLTFRGTRAYADVIASHLEDPKGPIDLPGPRKSFSWGRDGLSGVCVGPSSWCRGIVRS
jgi:hypothetical protein